MKSKIPQRTLRNVLHEAAGGAEIVTLDEMSLIETSTVDDLMSESDTVSATDDKPPRIKIIPIQVKNQNQQLVHHNEQDSTTSTGSFQNLENFGNLREKTKIFKCD